LAKNSTVYFFKDEINSPATRIIFARPLISERLQCLKLWRSCNDKLYNTEDIAKSTEYTLEGLAFNRRFARNVYIGIAPVKYINEKAKSIILGRLIKYPRLSELKTNVHYALIMKYLKKE